MPGPDIRACASTLCCPAVTDAPKTSNAVVAEEQCGFGPRPGANSGSLRWQTSVDDHRQTVKKRAVERMLGELECVDPGIHLGVGCAYTKAANSVSCDDLGRVKRVLRSAEVWLTAVGVSQVSQGLVASLVLTEQPLSTRLVCLGQKNAQENPFFPGAKQKCRWKGPWKPESRNTRQRTPGERGDTASRGRWLFGTNEGKAAAPRCRTQARYQLAAAVTCNAVAAFCLFVSLVLKKLDIFA
ncbi:putative transmembrane protein, partial [Toxoplasma gondii GAB2-2007-GAL-DOM2]